MPLPNQYSAQDKEFYEAMNSADKARDALLRAYSGNGWKKKVAAMSDSQATAVYLRLKAQNKI